MVSQACSLGFLVTSHQKFMIQLLTALTASLDFIQSIRLTILHTFASSQRAESFNQAKSSMQGPRRGKFARRVTALCIVQAKEIRFGSANRKAIS